MVPHILFGTIPVSFHTAAADNRTQIKNAHRQCDSSTQVLCHVIYAQYIGDNGWQVGQHPSDAEGIPSLYPGLHARTRTNRSIHVHHQGKY